MLSSGHGQYAALYRVFISLLVFKRKDEDYIFPPQGEDVKYLR